MSYPAPERIYLAARFVRQHEMREHAQELRAAGYLCDPAWLSESHDLPDDVKPDDPRGAEFAADDIHDLRQSDIVICFTEQPRSAVNGRGGRHVELGLAIAWDKRILIVGFRENVFCWLPQIEFHPSWNSALQALM